MRDNAGPVRRDLRLAQALIALAPPADFRHEPVDGGEHTSPKRASRNSFLPREFYGIILGLKRGPPQQGW
jgi:hypothetical protein